jgi:hypothetical protein
MDISSIPSAPPNQPPADAASAMTQLAAASASVQSRPGLLSFLRKPASWVRRHHRHPCCIVGVLDILDRGVPLDGLVTEISEGGALFRTASTFIFDRRRSTVALRFTDREWRGEIVNVKADGYGIRLDSPVTNEEIEHIIARYGAPDVAAN